MRGGAEADPAQLSEVVQELLAKEESYAEQNAKRLRLVVDAFAKDTFGAMVNIVDMLMLPLDHMINKLLQRTTLLKHLRYREVKDGKSMQSLKHESLSMFQRWVSGAMGSAAMGQFLKNLQSLDLAEHCRSCQSDAPALSMTCFQLTVFAVTDVWRRFSLAQQSFPWCMFRLMDCDDDEFCSIWTQFRAALTDCKECVDVAFSAPLLSAVDVSALDLEARGRFIRETQLLLKDIATYCPLGTDSVENTHAQNQSKLFAWRGSAKGEASAAETSVLSALGVEHMTLKMLVLGETMPSIWRLASMQKQVGRKADVSRPLPSRSHRATVAAQSKPRRLSPWNLFQREQLKAAGGHLSKQAYADVCKQAGDAWKLLSEQEREKYKVQTSFEQTCRDELESRPLSVTLEGASFSYWHTVRPSLHCYCLQSLLQLFAVSTI